MSTKRGPSSSQLARSRKSIAVRNEIRPKSAGFRTTSHIRHSASSTNLPDMMEASHRIEGSAVDIQQVGIAKFKLPLRVVISSVQQSVVEASISGTVSLAAQKKGIHMSRLMRSFYNFKDRVFDIDSLLEILSSYKKELASQSAHLRISFSFPFEVQSLRSGLQGIQYYQAAFEASVDARGRQRRFMEIDFSYSSACPCSSELAEHARNERQVYSVPHSQRSKARLRVELAKKKKLHLIDLRNKCLQALQTETQVMVKREDEQAFAELNGRYLKFVEDAARLVHQSLDSDSRICDFNIVCAHYESLHSHDAVSSICKGVQGGMKSDDFQAISQLL